MCSCNKKPRVALALDYIPDSSLSRLQQSCEIINCDTATHGITCKFFDAFRKCVVGVDAIMIVPPFKVDKEILELAGPQLKVVGTTSSGLDHIDLEECKKRGVKVGYTAHTAAHAVAEMTLTLTLVAARRLKEVNQALPSVHEGKWGSTSQNTLWMAGKQISGSVIGIVGLGRIGFAAGKRFKSFEPSRIVYCGHEVKSYASEISAEFVAFNDLLAMSDFVIITCSLNSTTKNLINVEAFKQMKNSSILVNVSRGGVVDQDALYDALTNKQIAAAGLDVTTPEPLPTDHKLLSLPNCVVTPHIASGTVETRTAMCNLTVDNILVGLNGEPLPFPAF